MSKIKLLVFFTCYLLISLVNYSSSHEHNHHHHDHDHDHHHEHENNHEPASFKYSKAANEKFQESQAASKGKNPPSNEPFETTQELWFYAIGSTLLISAAPFLILFLVPVDNTDSERPFLKILLAFASGGLLGDAFLHLIPQANSSVSSGEHSHDHATSHHGHSHSHSYDTSVGLWVLAGILAFFIVEKGVRIIKGSHSHSHKPKEVNKNDGKSNKTKNKSKEVKKVEKKSDVKIAGYLNLAADFSHNFTDGLAIGSSYLGGQTMGFVTTFLILLHEVPHEIGDFAILLQSGVPKRKAMLLQLVTAVGALSGTCISLFAQNAAEVGATSWILPFTAGGFIYIALVSVLPELLDEEKPSAFQTLLQLIALLAGLGMMVLITLFE